MARSKRDKFLEEGLGFLEGQEDNSTLSDKNVAELTETPKESILEESKVSVGRRSVTRVKAKGSEDPGFKSTAFGRNTSSLYLAEVGQLCPHCHYSLLTECMSFSGKPCEFFVYCPNCNAYICTYKPMPHQAEFHLDEHNYKLYAGGFGSAKTYTCGMEFLAYVLQIPNCAALMGAATWGQVSDTCLKFVTDNLPADLVAKSNQDKVNWYLDLVNGARISAKAFDKEGKIRSANLNIIWVEEASEVEYSVVTFIKARLRNKTAFFKGKNRLKMLLSSNPDVNWLNTDWLMISDKIVYHGDVADRYVLDKDRQDSATVTHISATSANIYLPPNYERDLAKNKPQWWVNRYLKGSFKYAEGLVYPNFSNWFCEPFIIPSHWKRITGTDFGRRDPTAHVVGALDPVNKVVYIYDEVEENLDDISLDELILKIKKVDNFPPYLLAYPNQCDPRGRNRDQVSGQSWISAYAARGVLMTPAEGCEGDSLAPTIQKIANYADNGKLKIFNTCVKIKASLSKYKYKPRTLGDETNLGEVPQDKNNHLPDAIRYMMAPFPAFPKDIDSFHDIWVSVIKDNHKHYRFGHELSNDNDYEQDYVSDFLDNFG